MIRKAFLARSGTALLRIFLILVDRDTERYTKFIEDNLPHADRLEEFYLSPVNSSQATFAYSSVSL